MKTKVFSVALLLAFIFMPLSMSYGQSYGWTKIMGGTSLDVGNGITTDSSGNVYVTGYFHGSANFGLDFGTTDIKTSAGYYDIFVTKINSNGSYGWTKIMGGTRGDVGNEITTDSSGNVYVAGHFSSTVNFGLDFGTMDIKISAGATDIFITKINSNGTYGWTKIMGGSEGDWGLGTVVNSSGNLYVTGAFTGTVNFGLDFGTTDIKTSAGDTDIFITKINSNGSYGWTKIMGGADFDSGYDIDVDSLGNVYATGYFYSTVNFGLDFGTTDIKISAGATDIFITKINSNATYGWTKIMGGTSSGMWEIGSGIATDPSGNLYVTGYFFGTVNFGMDFGTTDIKTSSGIFDIFITKINSNGAYGWTKKMGGREADWGLSIVINSSGNLYVTGAFTGTVNFGLDFGTTDIKTYAGGRDIFVTKINSNGAYGWTKIMGGADFDTGYDIAIDSSGNVYVTGGFQKIVDFGLDFGINDTKTSAGGYDAFVTKISDNADISISKTTDNLTPRTGKVFSFTVTATNNGPAEASGLRVTDSFPQGLACLSSTPSKGTYNSGTGIWDIGTLARGESAILILSVRGTVGGIFTNSAAVTALEETDPDSSNDSSSVSVTVIKTYTLTIAAGPGGTTSPAPGSYTYDEGTSVSVQALAATAYQFDNWTGDASGSANPVTVVMSSDKSIQANFSRVVKPPLNVTGEKLANRAVSMVEYVARLKWQPNSANTGTIGYRIYKIENSQATAIVDVGAGTYEYIVRRLEPTKVYRFGVMAVNTLGWESDMIEVTVQ